MRKQNKEQAMETLNPYERSRMQRVQECKARLLNSGIVDIKKSLTSLVDSQKNEKRKKNLKVADNGDADYGPNLDSSGDEDEEEEEDRVTTPTRNKVIKKMRKNKELHGAECQQDESAITPTNQATTKPVTRGMLQSMKYVPPATLKRYVNLTKHQRQGGGKSEKRKAPTVGELILKNKQLPREALMENTIALDGETGDQTLNEANLDWLSELDERANANRGMDELMAESENESDEESAAEEHERESDIDADVLDGLSESDEDENNTNDLDDRAIKELQIQGETKRGPTMLHKVHMRSFEKREAIILNEFGQPIGPVTPEKDTVGEFSRFLGQLLVIMVPHHYYIKTWNWFLVKKICGIHCPEQGKEWVLKTIEAAWRIHKCRFKKHYYRYPNNKLRWLNRPKRVPDDDFKKLLIIWNKKTEKRTRKRQENKRYADTYDDTARKIEAMKNYTPPDDWKWPKGSLFGCHGRLYGRGVTNKVLHKVASSSVNYVVPDEVMDALRADIQNEKTEIVDMRKELEADYERKKAELEANYAKKMEEFDKTKDKWFKMSWRSSYQSYRLMLLENF
ncbi:Multicopy suppressor of chk1 protein 1 [Bienertia sinuspersici]